MAERCEPSRPGAGSHAGTLDPAVMEQLLSLDDGGTGLLEEMLGLYGEDTPGRLDAMAQALGAGDMVAMADVAHAIKGAASTMGAPAVRDLAAELEALGRKARTGGDPAALLAELRKAYAESLTALEAFLEEKQVPGA